MYLDVCDDGCLLMTGHLMTFDRYGIVVHRLTVRINYLQGDVCYFSLVAVYELRTDTDIFVVAGGDKERMAGEVHVLRGCNDADITVESAASVPAGVAWLTGVSYNLYQVVFTILQVVLHVDH